LEHIILIVHVQSLDLSMIHEETKHYKQLGYSDDMINVIFSNKQSSSTMIFLDKNLKTVGTNGKNILTLACELNKEDLAIDIYDRAGYRYLLFEIDEMGNDPFTYICKNNMKKIFNLIQTETTIGILDYLIHDKVNKNNETLMIIICKNNLNNFGLKLLKNNFNFNLLHKDNNGNTALMYAIENNLIKLATTIIKKMKNVDQVNNNNETALIIASKQQNIKICKELLNNKKISTFINHVDNKKRSALIYASREDNFEIAKMIIAIDDNNISLKDIDDEDALSYSVSNYNEKLSILIATKWDDDFNHVYRNKHTVMLDAIYFRMTKLCDVILKSGKYDLEYIDHMNKTLLMWFIEKKMESQALFVIGSGEEFNCIHEDNFKNTALYYSASKNLPKITEKIINRRDCNVESTNIDGIDAVGNLLQYGHEDLVLKILKQHGSKLKDRYEDIYCVAVNLNMNNLLKFLNGKCDHNKIMKFVNEWKETHAAISIK
jgi:ankyrin repeat protein